MATVRPGSMFDFDHDDNVDATMLGLASAGDMAPLQDAEWLERSKDSVIGHIENFDHKGLRFLKQDLEEHCSDIIIPLIRVITLEQFNLHDIARVNCRRCKWGVYKEAGGKCGEFREEPL